MFYPFAILMGTGVGEAVKYAQARLPYTISQNVINASSFVSNAVGSYCISAGAPTPCNPTISQLNGYVPSTSISTTGPGGANGTYNLPDGSSLTLGNYGPSGSYGMRIGLGNLLASNPNYKNIVMNRIPGAFQGTNSIHVSQPLPAIANLSGQFVKLNPSTSLQTIQNGDLQLNGSFGTGGGVQAVGGIATNDIAPINGSPFGPYIDTHNGVFNNVGGMNFAGAISGQTPSQFWGCNTPNGCYNQSQSNQSQSNQLCLAPFYAGTARGGRTNGTWTFANGSSNGGGNNYGYVLVPCNAGPQGGW